MGDTAAAVERTDLALLTARVGGALTSAQDCTCNNKEIYDIKLMIP